MSTLTQLIKANRIAQTIYNSLTNPEQANDQKKYPELFIL